MRGEKSSRWQRLRSELLRRQQEGDPIRTIDDQVPNNIVEVGSDYVVLQSWSVHGTTRRILATEVEDDAVDAYVGKRRVLLALRNLADRLAGQ